MRIGESDDGGMTGTDRVSSPRRRRFRGKLADGCGNCRSRQDGCRHRAAADGGWPQAHGLESHAREDRAAAEAGATVAETPAEVAARSEIIITILTDAAAIDAVYDGPSGLLSGDVAGKLFVEMSTVQPATEVALAAKVRAKGAAFVECPVGGTTGPARQGQLVGLLGAEARRCRPRASLAAADVPADRALRAGRRGGLRQARDQPAADGVVAGVRRGFCAVPRQQARSRAIGEPVHRHFRDDQRDQGARAR